jgi:hypothetical protein
MTCIYILKLQYNKYYIGKTNNKKFRLKQHFNTNGSSWTKKYKPINIHQIIPDCDDFDEDKWTINYMKKYGINNVRGGTFCQLKLSDEYKNIINKMINSAENKCYKCGENGHFANQCNRNTTKILVWLCDYCGKEFKTKKGATYHENFYCKNKNYDESDYESDYEFDYESDYESDEDDNCEPIKKLSNKNDYKTSICYRCGRKGHYASKCYASKHIKGYYLKKR